MAVGLVKLIGRVVGRRQPHSQQCVGPRPGTCRAGGPSHGQMGAAPTRVSALRLGLEFPRAIAAVCTSLGGQPLCGLPGGGEMPAHVSRWHGGGP